jgi:hypothetical protein
MKPESAALKAELGKYLPKENKPAQKGKAGAKEPEGN